MGLLCSVCTVRLVVLRTLSGEAGVYGGKVSSPALRAKVERVVAMVTRDAARVSKVRRFGAWAGGRLRSTTVGFLDLRQRE